MYYTFTCKTDAGVKYWLCMATDICDIWPSYFGSVIVNWHMRWKDGLRKAREGRGAILRYEGLGVGPGFSCLERYIQVDLISQLLCLLHLP